MNARNYGWLQHAFHEQWLLVVFGKLSSERYHFTKGFSQCTQMNLVAVLTFDGFVSELEH